MAEHRMPLDDENSRAWTEIAHGTRLHWRILLNVGEPKPDSGFARVHALYPYDRAADRARAFISAALEHLLLWADIVAPFKFHPEQANVFQQRPPYTLARAALEASAQAVWMLDTTDPKECTKRHLSLLRWDLKEHHRSVIGADQRMAIEQRESELLERVEGIIPEIETRPPAGYLAVIQMACEAKDLDLEKGRVERLWRAASGSAHGMFWPTLELQQMVSLQDESGLIQEVRMPDADGITDVLTVAYKMTQHAVLQYAALAGADFPALIVGAMQWLVDHTPFKPDTDITDLHKLLTMTRELPTIE